MTDTVVYFSRDRKERIAQRERRLRYRVEVLRLPQFKATQYAPEELVWTVQSYARFKWTALLQGWSYNDLGDTRVIDQRKEGL